MDTEIINRALIKLGEPPVSSTNEIPNGKAFDIVYDDLRKSLLSAYYWRFAIKTENLAPLDEKTSTHRRYRYQLPSDYLLCLGVGEMYKTPEMRDYIMSSGERYVIVGDKIESNYNPLPLIYVRDVKETRLFSQWFKEALSAKIASEMTLKLNQNPNIKQMLEQDFANAISMAMHNNDIMQDTQAIGENSWVAIREAWYGD